MLNRLVITCSLLIYVAAMFVSLTAHDPFHAHHHPDHGQDKAVAHHEGHSHGKHSHSHTGHSHTGHSHKGHSHKNSHHHHKKHTHKHTSDQSGSEETDQPDSTGQDHDHDCPVCDFLMLKCLETSIAEVETASELIELAQVAVVNYHIAFSPYKPPSRAPPVC